MRKILVLRGGALGDFIVTLPALDLLRQRWPDAQIELVGNAVAAELARNRGLLDTVHSQHEGRWSPLFGGAPLPGPLAAWLGEFDLVLNYWPDPDDELQRHFPIRTGQTFLSASAMPSTAPAAVHYCQPLDALGLRTGELWWRLRPLVAASVSEWTTARNPPLAHARSYIAIHPGSGSSKKNWPKERWLDLIASLASPIVLVLGEAELESWDEIHRDHSKDRRIQVAASRSLEELVVLFSGAQIFLGHDSGVSHLAAACGIPCLLLFGPTDPSMWAPPAPHVRVLRRGPELTSLSVADVLAALSS